MAGFFSLSSAGLIFIFVVQPYFHIDDIIFFLIGVTIIIIGIIGILFYVRKYIRKKSKEESELKVTHDIDSSHEFKSSIPEQASISPKTIEDVIYEYLKKNG